MPVKPVDWRKAQRKAARTARWAVTMTKVRIRRVLSRTRWEMITCYGSGGGESVGIVDLIAIRKDHSEPVNGFKRGDALEIVLIQVKGGGAALPTVDDWKRLRAVAKRYRAKSAVLAAWKKGHAARFFLPNRKPVNDKLCWTEVADLREIFR
jgi:hypothetical protein